MKNTYSGLDLKKIKISKLTNLSIIVGGNNDSMSFTTLGQMSQDRNACTIGNGGS